MPGEDPGFSAGGAVVSGTDTGSVPQKSDAREAPTPHLEWRCGLLPNGEDRIEEAAAAMAQGTAGLTRFVGVCHAIPCASTVQLVVAGSTVLDPT